MKVHINYIEGFHDDPFALRENVQISTKQSGKSTSIATIIISAAYNNQIRFNVHLDSASESSKNLN